MTIFDWKVNSVKKKKGILLFVLMLFTLVISCKIGFSTDENNENSNKHAGKEKIVIGFSQLGAESDWRSAHTESMKSTFTDKNGYELIINDGQQKQSNQIAAIRTFIRQDVDYIVLAPVTETGWDTVLQEAKDAGIPVIIVDRMVDVEDKSLFSCWIGSDFELEGKKVAEWLNQYTISKGIKPEELNIVNIQGTIGASAQIGRTKGLEKAVKENGWNLLSQVSGDFTQAKGREVMSELLEEYDNINVVYCENDNEALGAIIAIESIGKKVGSNISEGEIMVISFDGVNEKALENVLNDRITCIAECNPSHGPRVQAVINMLEKGKTPDKFYYVEEDVFCANDVVKTLTIDENEYIVTRLTEDIINSKK